MRYSVKVVLVGEVEADNVDEAYNMADYHAGAMTEHEVEICALELKSEPLKMASILRAEASKGLKQSATKRGHHPAFDEYGEHR